MNSFKFYSGYTFLIFILLSSTLNCQTENIEIYLEGTKITDIKNDGVDLWVTTEGNGIYKYIKWKDEWINFSTKNKKLRQDLFYCIEIGPRYIWAGSPDGLYTYDKKRKRWSKKRFALGGQFGNWIRALEYDKTRNILWIGRFKFLSQFDLISKRYKDFNLTKNKIEKSNSVKSLSIDGDSVLYIGVENGLHKYNLNDTIFSTKYLTNEDNYFLSEGDQVSLTNIIFEQGNIWFGTEEFVTLKNPEFNLGGLFRFDRKVEWIKFDEFNSLNGSGIFSLAITGNYIWSSVYKFDPVSKLMIGKGINIINRKTLEVMNVESDFIPDYVYSIHFDGEYIWLGTNDGLRKVYLTNKIIPNFE